MADYQIYLAKTAELGELKNEISAVEDAIRAILASEGALDHEENGFLDRLRNKRVVLYAQYDLCNIEALLIWCQVGAANGTLPDEYASKVPSWEASRRIYQGRLIFARTQRQVLMAATMPPAPEETTVFAARLLDATSPVLEEVEQPARDPISAPSSHTLGDEQEWETVSEEDIDLIESDSSHTMRGDSAERGSEAGYDADSESGGHETETLLSSVEDAGDYEDEDEDEEGEEQEQEEEEEDYKPARRTGIIYNRRTGEWQRW